MTTDTQQLLLLACGYQPFTSNCAGDFVEILPSSPRTPAFGACVPVLQRSQEQLKRRLNVISSCAMLRGTSSLGIMNHHEVLVTIDYYYIAVLITCCDQCNHC